MRIREAWRLSHREFSVFRTRSIATVVTVGVLFGLLLAVIVVIQGLENVTMRYARAETNGAIYLMSEYPENKALVLERVRKYGGEVVEDGPEVVAKFQNVRQANEYYEKGDAQELKYSANQYQIKEVRGNQLGVYRYFRALKRDFVRPVSVVLLVVAAVVLAFTLAHLVSQSARTFALYRSLGASRGQVLGVYFWYLLEICFWAAVLAVGLALVLAGIATAAGWGYLTEQLARHYPGVAFFPPVLVGVNWVCAEVIAGIFGAAPVAFLLCLDQFSEKKMALRMKGD